MTQEKAFLIPVPCTGPPFGVFFPNCPIFRFRARPDPSAVVGESIAAAVAA